MTDTPNVVNMETAARLIREAKEAREKHRMWVQSINMPFERLPVCACDPGFGDPPSALKMISCGQCSGTVEATVDQLPAGPPQERPQFPGGIDDLEV